MQTVLSAAAFPFKVILAAIYSIVYALYEYYKATKL